MKKKAKKEVMVNLGCGSNLVDGFINVDNYVGPLGAKGFIHADIRFLPFEKDSVDYILCDQVLEHIPMYDIPTVLHEMRRVLKVGGRAVIMVPDFRSAAEDWLKVNHEEGFDPFLTLYVSEVIYGNQLHEGEYHKTAMSAGFLNYALNMVGFNDKKLTLCPKFSDIPQYPGMRPTTPGARLRNAQLIADIIKTK